MALCVDWRYVRGVAFGHCTHCINHLGMVSERSLHPTVPHLLLLIFLLHASFSSTPSVPLFFHLCTLLLDGSCSWLLQVRNARGTQAKDQITSYASTFPHQKRNFNHLVSSHRKELPEQRALCDDGLHFDKPEHYIF